MRPHKDSDIRFRPVRRFGLHICSAPLRRKLSVTLIILLMSLSHAQSQHSVTRTKKSLSRANPAPKFNPQQHASLCGFPHPPANAGTRNPRRLNSPAQDSILQSGRFELYRRNQTRIIMEIM